MPDASELSLRIILVRPPAGIDYALQKGRGAGYETFQKQRSKGKDLTFEFTVAVKSGRTPSFIGPFVQGSSRDKFVYLDIGRYAGQQDTECARRLKVPLSGITADMVRSGKPLQATIPGTGKDGTPSCAYIWRKQVGSDWGWRPAPKR